MEETEKTALEKRLKQLRKTALQACQHAKNSFGSVKLKWRSTLLALNIEMESIRRQLNNG